MILHHVTRGENLGSILQLGLWPRFARGLTLGDDRKDAVWLTDDPLWIVERQSGWNWATRNQASVVMVRCIGLRVMPYMAPTRRPKPIPHEFLVEGIIPPDHLVATVPVSALAQQARKRSARR
jgi:hypothetical protein